MIQNSSHLSAPQNSVVLENNNEYLTQLSAEGLPLCRSLHMSLYA
jgi:hypothetical protein